MDVIVGTAGHIDHGKTALVKALTGTDTDRLPEEKKRGITIDLGFAELEAGDVRFGFVDVPGHERFVKNMLAGASGIDLVMLVIAADEGVMPQTREHFDICRLLNVKRGVVVLTKSDLIDDEMLELVKLEAAELTAGSFLADAPVVAVSSKSGAGIDELRSELIRAAAGISNANKNIRIPILPIDRRFTKKGFGTVITGTLASGEIVEGDELDLLPVGKRVRVRGLQTHGRIVQKAHAGQRTAVNLASVDHDEIERGMVLAEKGILRPTQAFDSEVEVLADANRPLRSRQRVRFHIGSTEALARIIILNDRGEIASGESGLVQLRLESPVVAAIGDRFVLRSYSPQVTVAGGVVLDTSVTRHRRKERADAIAYLNALAESMNDPGQTVQLLVSHAGERGTDYAEIRAKTAWTDSTVKNAIGNAANIFVAGDALITRSSLEALKAKIVNELKAFHAREPLLTGIPREMVRERVFSGTLVEIAAAVFRELGTEQKIESAGEMVRLAGHASELRPVEFAAKSKLETIYRFAKLEPPKLSEALGEAAAVSKLKPDNVRRIFQLLIDAGEVVKVSDEFYFHSEQISNLKANLAAFRDATPDRSIDVSKFKELAGVSRKYAIPLLEYFDRAKVTVRSGDKRLIL
jgi:selenocysteine-specific elongation factor